MFKLHLSLIELLSRVKAIWTKMVQKAGTVDIFDIINAKRLKRQLIYISD